MSTILKDINAEIYRQLERHVTDETRPGSIPQPLFIAGRSGAGKTTLLQHLISELKKEGYFNRILFFYGKQFFNSNDILDAIESNSMGLKRIEESEDPNKRPILLIDDFDYFLKRASFDDQYKLREYLNQENAPLLIATISKIGKALSDYRAPFFEGVRILYVPPLTPSLIKDLGFPAKKYERALALMDYLPPVIGSLKLVLDILTVSHDKKEDLQKLLDYFSAFYRMKLERLPIHSQRILYFMSLSDSPITLTDLRLSSGLPAGTLSTYLRQLVKNGEIERIGKEKRGISYNITDKLFKLWLRAAPEYIE